jgi:O-antigen/teichoic acid export membrane protein
LILAVLGDKWAGVIPVFKIFCWVGLLQSISTTVGEIYQSQGRTGLYFVMGVVGIPAVVLAFVIGVRWGIIGVAWSYLIIVLIWWYPCWTVPGRLIGLTFWEMARKLSPTFFCALAMGAGVWLVGLILPVGMAHWQCLVIQIPIGVVLYFALVVNLNLDAWQEGRRAFSEMAGERLKPVKALLARPIF